MTGIVRNVLTLGSGAIVAQAISLGAVPVITRLYSPDNFGVFAIYVSIATIVFMVSTLRFNVALMLPKEEVDAANLLALALFCVFSFSVVSTLVVVCVLFFGIPDGSVGQWYWLMLLPLGIFIQGVHQSVVLWTLRQRRFGWLAWGRISEAVGDRGTTLTLGVLASTGHVGLILGRLLGPLTALSFLYLKHRGVDGHGWPVADWSGKRMWALARRYKAFPLQSTVATFVNLSAREAPTFLLAFLFSPIVTGLYALGAKVLQAPLLLVGDALAKALLQHATREADKSEQLAEGMERVFCLSLYIMVPPVMVLLVFGEQLFATVFGAKWARAGVYAQILSIMFIGVFLDRALSVLFDAFEQQAARLKFDLSLFAARVGGISLAAWLAGTPEAALGTMACLVTLVYVTTCWFQFRLVGRSGHHLFAIFRRSLKILSPVIIGVPILRLLPDIPALGQISLIILLIAGQAALVLSVDRTLREELTAILRRPSPA